LVCSFGNFSLSHFPLPSFFSQPTGGATIPSEHPPFLFRPLFFSHFLLVFYVLLLLMVFLRLPFSQFFLIEFVPFPPLFGLKINFTCRCLPDQLFFCSPDFSLEIFFTIPSHNHKYFTRTSLFPFSSPSLRFFFCFLSVFLLSKAVLFDQGSLRHPSPRTYFFPTHNFHFLVASLCVVFFSSGFLLFVSTPLAHRAPPK